MRARVEILSYCDSAKNALKNIRGVGWLEKKKG
jgi:hypothetical protein